MSFRDRDDAAHRLAQELAHYRGRRPLVLAIPRGAVPMGVVIADALGGELDVVLVHKLGAPGNPELAIGSVDESGHVYLSEDADALELSESYIETERQAQVEMLQQRRVRYTAARPPADPTGRIVLVVDDGMATGSSMIAALRAVRARKPAELIAVAAVAPGHTVAKLETYADRVVCLEVPPVFYAVGQFFEQFDQVSDDDVVTILRKYP